MQRDGANHLELWSNQEIARRGFIELGPFDELYPLLPKL